MIKFVDDKNITVERICPFCGATTLVPCAYSAWENYVEGALVQDAFPDMPREQRETLITGACVKCQERIISDYEDDGCNGECDDCPDYECPGNVFHEEYCDYIESGRGK